MAPTLAITDVPDSPVLTNPIQVPGAVTGQMGNDISRLTGEVTYVRRTLAGRLVRERQADHYFDATAMCKAARKAFADWRRLKETGEFLGALEANMGIPIVQLIQSLSGGLEAGGGTWVHPKVAIALAMWCSPEFHVQVINWVYGETTGEGPVTRSEFIAAVRGALAPRFDYQDQKLEEQGLELKEHGRELKEQCLEIRAFASRLDRIETDQGRRDFTEAIKRRVYRENFRQNGGICPVTETRIQDERGNPIPGKADVHHIGSHRDNKFSNAVPLSVEAHKAAHTDERTSGPSWIAARDAGREFHRRYNLHEQRKKNAPMSDRASQIHQGKSVYELTGQAQSEQANITWHSDLFGQAA